jgi:tetratricopeptide (TPR) repeat protein
VSPGPINFHSWGLAVSEAVPSDKATEWDERVTEKPKSSGSKSKIDQPVGRQSGYVLQMQKSGTSKAPPPPDPKYTQAVQNYESGLKAMQERKFDKAKGLLEKVISGPSKELADRARVHLNTCNQQLSRGGTSFKSLNEHYDYAVSLMNSGDYDEARSHMEKILRQNPKADFAFYGVALLDCLTNRSEDCLRNLNEAIKLNAANRFQARNDPDFKNMADDPRFTELLYPEVPPEPQS